MSHDDSCDHPPCTCTVGSDGGIENPQGQHYCSQSCADGDGCVCPECGCSMQTVDGDTAAVPML